MAPRTTRSDAWPLLAITLLAALVSLIIDSQTRYHLGDSDTFLHTGWPRALPIDRPWLYGLFATDSIRLARDVSIIPKLQVAIAAGGALLLAMAMMRRFGAPLAAAATLAVVILAEPLSAWWARSVMSDTLATAALCTTIAAAIWPGLPAPLRALAVFGGAVLLFFLRSVHTVPLATAGALYPLVCWIAGRWLPALAAARREALAVGLALVAAVGTFAVVNTKVLGQPRIALNHESSRFLLGALVPLLAGQEHLIPLPAERIAALQPFDRSLRLVHTFAPTGIVEQLRAEHGAAAEAIGLRLAQDALRGAPGAAMLLWARNWADYLDPRVTWRYHIEGRWSGATPHSQPNRLSAGTMERLRALGAWQGPREEWPLLGSPALRWFRIGGGVSALLIAWAATLALPVVAATRLRQVPAAWLLAGTAAAMMGFMTATVNEYVSRYLVAMLPALLALGLLWRLAPRPAEGIVAKLVRAARRLAAALAAPVDPARGSGGPRVATLLLCLLGGGMLSVQFGTDRNWDLQNYHLYGPYALLNGRMFHDIAPAQLQSFFNPVLHLPHQLLFFALIDRPRLFAFLMGLPAGLLGFLVLRIAWVHAGLLAPTRGLAWAATAICGTLGLTGVAVLPAVGLSTFDIVATVPLALAYLLVLGEVARRRAGRGARVVPLVVAGAAAGLAAGLNLTVVPFAAAIGLMILLLLGFRAAVVAGSAMGVSFLAGFGPFAWQLWQATGNPLFPHYNAVFRSPEWLPANFQDRRFLPRSALQAVFYPFWWLTPTSGLVTELRMRDPRVALGYVAAVLLAVMLLARRGRSDGRAAWLALGVAALSYAVWAQMFGIYRYVPLLEVLAALLVMLALLTALRRLPWVALGAFAAITGGAVAFTIHPNWGHGPHGARVLEVEPLPVQPGSLVVTVDATPMAYLVTLMPPDIRALGLSTNLVRPGQEHGINRRITAAIEGHGGPIWSIAHHATPQAEQDAVLAAHGLAADGACLLVRSSLEPGGHRFCPVRKSR